jgi:peroxiredoxin
MKKTKLFMILTVIVFLAIACKTSPTEGVREAPEIGALAPRFTLEDTNGTEISLSDQRGQVVLINFWATWCPPCRQEMPGIQNMFEQHQEDLVVLAIDNDEPENVVRDFQEEFDLTFNILLDPAARVQLQYQIRSYPTSLFVDQNGIIQIVHIGLMTESQLEGYLAQMGLG